MGDNIIILKRIKDGSFIFSLISLISSSILFVIILINRKLSYLTYTFLTFILLSEIIHTIGNIVQSCDGNNIVVISFISFSDIFTNLLFLFFSYYSMIFIKEADKNIFKSVPKYIIISSIAALFYFIIFLIIVIIKPDIDLRFSGYYYEDDENKFKSSFYFCSLIHTVTIIITSYFTGQNIYDVVAFLNKKFLRDKVNSAAILRLMKIFYRYGFICILYWAFLVPRILLVAICGKTNNLFRDIIYLFSELFFCLRGFFISMNTLSSSKIQKIINKFFEVNIKHFLLVNLGLLSSRKLTANSIKNKDKDKEDIKVLN
jgi:hypothetical protein